MTKVIHLIDKIIKFIWLNLIILYQVDILYCYLVQFDIRQLF